MGTRFQETLTAPTSKKRFAALELPHAPSIFGVRPVAATRRFSDFLNLLSWWKKLPQLVNLFFHYQHDNAQTADVLNYEPIHLQVTTATCSTPSLFDRQQDKTENDRTEHMLNAENFRFLLEQLPAIRTIAFSGQSDPLRNEHVMDMVDLAYRFNHADSTIYTDGKQIDRWIDRMLASPLACLTVKLHSHKPSHYSRMTGHPPNDFVTIRDNLLKLVARKRQLESSLIIDLGMTVDLHNFHDIPEMIAFAESLGVDGVNFENYLSLNPEQKSDRTLYTQQAAVVKFFKHLEETILPKSKLLVSLPTLLDVDMSQHRHCRDPFTTVAVDADFTIMGCSRHLAYPGSNDKVWDSDFWNNTTYQWLRSIHTPQQIAKQTVEDAKATAVPALCQYCPLNMPRKPH